MSFTRASVPFCHPLHPYLQVHPLLFQRVPSAPLHSPLRQWFMRKGALKSLKLSIIWKTAAKSVIILGNWNRVGLITLCMHRRPYYIYSETGQQLSKDCRKRYCDKLPYVLPRCHLVLALWAEPSLITHHLIWKEQLGRPRKTIQNCPHGVLMHRDLVGVVCLFSSSQYGFCLSPPSSTLQCLI